MTDALRYEWVRIRTIRSTWWLTGIAVVGGIGLSFLIAMGVSIDLAEEGDRLPAEEARLFGGAMATQFASFGLPYLVVYVLAMIAVLAWGHEYRHGMIRATLTALSSRTAAWVAKLLVVAAWLVATAFVTMMGSLFAGWLWLRDDRVEMVTSQTWGVVGRTLVYVLLFTLVAAAFTSLVRNQTVALVMLFLWPLMVESIVDGLFTFVPFLRDHAELTRFLPFDAGARLVVQSETPPDGLFGDPLSATGGGLVFGLLAVVLVVAGFVLFHRRDA